VEGKRLSRLINALLELEKQREPFEVIGFEQQVLQEVQGQPIRLFIDRIDRLAEGQTAVIDYKSGQVDPKKWFGERPEDPQLPLYAVSAAEAPAALVFAVARDEACGYRGVVNAAGLFPGLPPGRGSNSEQLVEAGRDMTRTIRTWRETLERLMAAFLSGQAAVDPKDGERTCRDSYCELHSLCRVDELRQLTGAD
jgi:RecB family exonuclease